jgi:hypothetical protein
MDKKEVQNNTEETTLEEVKEVVNSTENKTETKLAPKKREFKKNVRSRKPQGRFERPKPEFDQKIVDVRRVTRVVK